MERALARFRASACALQTNCVELASGTPTNPPSYLDHFSQSSHDP